jgi:hypothetical protein
MHFLSLFTIPCHVANKIERLLWNFVGGGEDGKRKYHLVGWEEVCSPLRYGGLRF